MRILLRGSVIFCFLFLGCSKIDPKIEAPSYIEIDDYSVVTDTNTQGTSLQAFTNVMVLTGTENLGYYPLPAKIPIAKNGNTRLNIRPAIKVNGVSYLRDDYPVMAGYDTIFPLKQGEVLKVKPVFKYYTSSTFPVLENFEKVNVTVTNSNPSDTVTAKIDGTNAVYGSKCLMMQIDPSHTVSQVQSVNGFTVATSGANTYVEINYKGNMPLEVGVIGSQSQGSIIPSSSGNDQRSAGGVRPSDVWKKLYINLSEIVRYPPYHNYYFLYFYIANTMTDPPTSSGQVFIDNIKVVRQ